MPISGTPGQAALITEQEARLPNGPAPPILRGISRRPKVSLVSPAGNEPQRSPVQLKVTFESFGGSRIDRSSVKVLYVKSPTVDITERMGPYMDDKGIEVSTVLPSGDHVFRIELKDTGGREGAHTFKVTVTE